MSNQRPSSIPEFKHTKDRKGASYLNFDKEGICDACNFAIEKKKNQLEKKRKKNF